MKRGLVLLITALTVAGGVRAEPLNLDDAIIENVLRIRAIDPERRDDAFSKMGGSSVASKAFLQCFATEYIGTSATCLAADLRTFGKSSKQRKRAGRWCSSAATTHRTKMSAST